MKILALANRNLQGINAFPGVYVEMGISVGISGLNTDQFQYGNIVFGEFFSVYFVYKLNHSNAVVAYADGCGYHVFGDVVCFVLDAPVKAGIGGNIINYY